MLKRITAGHQAEFDKASVRELLRPIIGEGMVEFEGNGGGIAFNGTPYEVEFEGRVFAVSAQDIDGLVNPFQTLESLMRALLPSDWEVLARKIAQSDDRSLPLALLAARLGATADQIRVVERWLTSEGQGKPLNALSLAERYMGVEPDSANRILQFKQTTGAVLVIEW